MSGRKESNNARGVFLYAWLEREIDPDDLLDIIDRFADEDGENFSEYLADNGFNGRSWPGLAEWSKLPPEEKDIVPETPRWTWLADNVRFNEFLELAGIYAKERGVGGDDSRFFDWAREYAWPELPD